MNLRIHNDQGGKDAALCREAANAVVLLRGGADALNADAGKGIGNLVEIQALFAGVLAVDDELPVFVVDLDGQGRGLGTGELYSVNRVFQHVAHHGNEVGGTDQELLFCACADLHGNVCRLCLVGIDRENVVDRIVFAKGDRAQTVNAFGLLLKIGNELFELAVLCIG